jgi:hypothetical protein
LKAFDDPLHAIYDDHIATMLLFRYGGLVHSSAPLCMSLQHTPFITHMSLSSQGYFLVDTPQLFLPVSKILLWQHLLSYSIAFQSFYTIEDGRPDYIMSYRCFLNDSQVLYYPVSMPGGRSISPPFPTVCTIHGNVSHHAQCIPA